MPKELVLKLRYLGSIPQVGYIEYGFRITEKDRNFRQIVLTIEDAFFQRKDLKFQEAPDLCYQKVLADLNDERPDSGIPACIPVTALDIAHYRDLHPTARSRKTLKEIRSSHRTDSESHRVNELRAGNIPEPQSPESSGAGN
ncbi:MAG: hypothetical protein JXR49_22900 [Acidobacteria bacterium]|nr:hypothetical protein [Acidobacteriota bacterium]